MKARTTVMLKMSPKQMDQCKGGYVGLMLAMRAAEADRQEETMSKVPIYNYLTARSDEFFSQMAPGPFNV